MHAAYMHAAYMHAAYMHAAYNNLPARASLACPQHFAPLLVPISVEWRLHGASPYIRCSRVCMYRMYGIYRMHEGEA